jgi:ABC-2 type transport system ATP-binding protein
MNVIDTCELGKRYGKSWALRDCTLSLPAGHLAALVGPNGAGKSTLMNMAAGLTVPTAGTVTVLGGHPAGSPAALNGVAFVAQDAPVYKNLSAGDMLHLTRNLNQRFDTPFARARLADLGIPLGKKAGRLSGGQQSQLALTLALARRPRLLILDEPLAALDPIARQDFLAAVMTAMADDGVSVLLSSHQVAELERVADFLIVLSRARLQLAGEVDDLLAGHRLLTGPTAEADEYAGRLTVVQTRRGDAQTHLLARTGDTPAPVPPGWESHQVSLEEVVMAYLRSPGVSEPAAPSRIHRPQPTEAAR